MSEIKLPNGTLDMDIASQFESISRCHTTLEKAEQTQQLMSDLKRQALELVHTVMKLAELEVYYRFCVYDGCPENNLVTQLAFDRLDRAHPLVTSMLMKRRKADEQV